MMNGSAPTVPGHKVFSPKYYGQGLKVWAPKSNMTTGMYSISYPIASMGLVRIFPCIYHKNQLKNVGIFTKKTWDPMDIKKL